MGRTVTVVAHFDPDDRLDPTFLSTLNVVTKISDLVILVTTSNLPSSVVSRYPNVRLMRRPNIGYDFYSYKIGIWEAIKMRDVTTLFLMNSSFIVVDERRFMLLLTSMKDSLKKTDIIGFTESKQIVWHIQSYLIALRESVLYSQWFGSWLDSIAPRNTKFETIAGGEFSLSRAIAHSKCSHASALSLSFTDSLLAVCSWGKYILTRGGVFERFSALITLGRYNPTHFAARALARQGGIVKTELLRNNPHRLNLDWFDSLYGTSLNFGAVNQFLSRCRPRYVATKHGLTGLAAQNSSTLISYKLLLSGNLALPGVRVAVIAHVYYPELIGELAASLKNILVPFDVFVTTPHEGAVVPIIDKLAPLCSTIAVALCENRGRDVGPFMAIHRTGLLDCYTAVLKLHTKKSTYSEHGGFWQQNLYRELCGDSYSIKKAIALLEEGRAGIIGPHEYYLTHAQYWGANRQKVHELLSALGIASGGEDEVDLGFFAGTMFWFAPQALLALHELPDALLNFEPEAGKQDGTLAHAIERLFCLVARANGYSATSLPLEGNDIHTLDNSLNSVPVLKPRLA